MVKEKTTTASEKPVKGKFFSGTGRRKTSVARVWLFEKGRGAGEGMVVNGLPIAKYFHSVTREQAEASYLRPMQITDVLGKFTGSIKVRGGGIYSQLEAVTHGLSRALVEFNPEFRALLKTEKLLTRDSRMKERKKYGHLRARRKPQWSKR